MYLPNLNRSPQDVHYQPRFLERLILCVLPKRLPLPSLSSYEYNPYLHVIRVIVGRLPMKVQLKASRIKYINYDAPSTHATPPKKVRGSVQKTKVFLRCYYSERGEQFTFFTRASLRPVHEVSVHCHCDLRTKQVQSETKDNTHFWFVNLQVQTKIRLAHSFNQRPFVCTSMNCISFVNNVGRYLGTQTYLTVAVYFSQ